MRDKSILTIFLLAVIASVPLSLLNQFANGLDDSTRSSAASLARDSVNYDDNDNDGKNNSNNPNNTNAGNAGKGPPDIASFIIQFTGKPTDEDVSYVKANGGHVDRIYTIINGMSISIPSDNIDALAHNPRIASIEPDVEVQATGITLDKQIRADLVWTRSSNPSTGSGIPIAILDTGIDKNHPEFSGRIVQCRSEIFNADGICDDQNGHGTHVAGIASAAGVNAQAKGVAPSSVLYVNQVLDSTGSGSLSGMIAGIDWAHTKGAKVVSMSLSTTYTTSVDADCDAKFPSLAAAINNAVAAGVIIVAAAGNSGSAGVGAPGCIGNSIAVGAVDGSDNIASFSGRGSAMADHGLVAPGVSVYSSYKGGTYATASGTSMATPAVAGTVALMLAIDQNLGPSDVKNALSENTCKQSSSPSCPTGSVPNNSYGSGRVDSYTSTTTSGSTTSDFSLSTSASAITIPKGKSGSLTVTIQSLNNLASSNIMLTLTPATSGISYGFSPSSVSLAAGGDAQSTLTINVGKNAPAGTHSFTITAVSKDTTPELLHSGQITVKVSKR